MALTAASVALPLAVPMSQAAHAGPIATVAAGDPADLVEAFGESHFASTFAGIEGVNDGARIAVYLTGLAPDVEAAFDAVQRSVPIEFHLAPRSRQSMFATHEKLAAAWESLRKQGIDVDQFYADLESGVEKVAVIDMKPSDVSAINQLVGAGVADVYSISQDTAHASRVTSRINDTSPFNGGDGINDSVFSCTTGFGVTIGGVSRLTTAGHCFPNYDSLANGLQNFTTGNFDGGEAPMGQAASNNVVWNGTYYTGTDTEVATTSGSHLIWRGDIGSAYRATVSGRLGNYAGYQVCQSGAYSGETCSTLTTTADVCHSFYDNVGNRYDLCHVYLASRSDGGIANEDGNSGGPVFRLSGGLVYASGTVTGQDTDAAHLVPCVHYNPNTCSSDLWLTGEYYVLQVLGATLQTG